MPVPRCPNSARCALPTAARERPCGAHKKQKSRPRAAFCEPAEPITSSSHRQLCRLRLWQRRQHCQQHPWPHRQPCRQHPWPHRRPCQQRRSRWHRQRWRRLQRRRQQRWRRCQRQKQRPKRQPRQEQQRLQPQRQRVQPFLLSCRKRRGKWQQPGWPTEASFSCFILNQRGRTITGNCGNTLKSKSPNAHRRKTLGHVPSSRRL